MEKTNKISRSGVFALAAVLSIASHVAFAAENVGNAGETGMTGKNSVIRATHGAATIGVSGNGAVFDGTVNPLMGTKASAVNSPIGGSVRDLPGVMDNSGGYGTNNPDAVDAVSTDGSRGGRGRDAVIIENTNNGTVVENVLATPQDVTTIGSDADLMRPTGGKSVFE